MINHPLWDINISNMLKAMLSQPIDEKTTHEKYVATKEKATTALKDKGYEVIDMLYADDWCSEEQIQKRGVVQISLYFLAKSLENMSLCHAVYFCKGWEKIRKLIGRELKWSDDAVELK